MSVTLATTRDRHRLFAVRDPLPTAHLAAAVGLAGIVFLVAAAVAATGEVPAWEAELLRWVNGWPDALEPAMWTIQQGGVLAGPVICGALIAWWARRWRYLVAFALLVPLKLGVEWLVIKQLVERGRPWETVGHDLTVRGPALEGLSFPSGHATTAMASAVLLMALLPRRWRPIPIVWAVAVGVARLYSGEHNVLDVVGGLALGTIYGVCLWYAVLDRTTTGSVPGGRP